MKPEDRFDPPPKGWVRAIREALGMTGVQFARRLRVTPQSAEALEKSEANGTIQLKTLRRAAEALDCRLVYALVPNSSLEDNVAARAREWFRERLARPVSAPSAGVGGGPACAPTPGAKISPSMSA